MAARALAEIRHLVEGITPFDRLEEQHRSDVLSWLSRTDDVFRRARPRTPKQHLVSYFLVVDPVGPHVLLVDHIKAGKWLPTGGHVEPGESAVDTVRREVREELGIQARFPTWIGVDPVTRAERLEARRAQLQRVCDALDSSSVPLRYEASCVR